MDEFMGFSMLVVIMACMAWIWRKLTFSSCNPQSEGLTFPGGLIKD